MLNLESLINRPDFEQERSMMGTAAAIGFGVSGVLGFAAVALPVPDSMDVPALAAISLAGIVSAPLIWWARLKIPLWGYRLMTVVGIGVITLSILANGDPAQSNELFYLYVVCFVFYFFSWIEAATYTIAALVGYGAALASIGDERIEPTALLIFIGVALMMGTAVRFVGGKQRRLHAELERQATTDHLTGLVNRRGLQRLVDEEMERAVRTGRPFSLLIGDLDHFKAVNDRLGHMGGDMALERVANALVGEGRKMDTIARIGGEEFAILMPETSTDQALTAAERFRGRIGSGFESRPVQLTISIGIATFPRDGDSLEQLLRAADSALYTAKAAGRDRVVASNDSGPIITA